MISPPQIKKYFKKPEIVNFDELLINGHLKRAGIDTLDTSNDTLFGTVRSWTNGESGKSNAATDTRLENNGRTDSSKNYFTSFEEASTSIENPKPGDVIKINGEFEYSPGYKSEDTEGWKPVVLYR